MRPEDQRKGNESYAIIPRVLIFLTHGDEILLLNGAPDKKLWAGKYNGLGGHVEPRETPYQAAVREVYEEAGLQVESLNLRAIVHITLPQPPGVMLFVFVGESARTTVCASREGIPVWVRRSDLDTLPLVEDLPQLLAGIESHKPLTFGHYEWTEAGFQCRFT